MIKPGIRYDPRCRRLRCFASIVLLAAAIHVSAAQPSELRLTFEQRAVIVDGVTPGGEVAIFSLLRKQLQLQHGHTSTSEALLTDGGRGSVRYETKDAIDPRRLWVVIDQTNGHYAVSRAAGGEPVERIPPGRFKHGTDSGGSLSIRLSIAHLILVRPGEGAWRTFISDGGRADSDGVVNGTTVCTPDKLGHFRHGRSANDKFAKDDVLVVIDPFSQRVYDVRLK